MNLHWNQQSLLLLPENAIVIPTSPATLVISDVHLGKSATFRAHGLAVPEGDTERDFSRILELLDRFQTRRCVINGDLFHAPSGITPELADHLESFLHQNQIDLQLVEGNHDARIRCLPAGITSLPSLEIAGFHLVHDPREVDPHSPLLHLCGHWHPVVRIADGRRTSLRLPCFLLRRNLLIQPSFGSFTGGAIMKPEPGDRFFASTNSRVVEVPASLIR